MEGWNNQLGGEEERLRNLGQDAAKGRGGTSNFVIQITSVKLH